MSKERTIIIYGLYDCADTNKTIRYIGKTCNIIRRVKDHKRIHLLKYNSHKKSWIQSILNAKSDISYVTIEEATIDNWKEKEKCNGNISP